MTEDRVYRELLAFALRYLQDRGRYRSLGSQGRFEQRGDETVFLVELLAGQGELDFPVSQPIPSEGLKRHVALIGELDSSFSVVAAYGETEEEAREGVAVAVLLRVVEEIGVGELLRLLPLFRTTGTTLSRRDVGLGGNGHGDRGPSSGRPRRPPS